MSKYPLAYKNGKMCVQETRRDASRNQVSLLKGEEEGGMSFVHMSSIFCSQTLQPWLGLQQSSTSSSVSLLLPITSARISSKYVRDSQALRVTWTSGRHPSVIQSDPHKEALFPSPGTPAFAHTGPTSASPEGDPSSTGSHSCSLTPSLGNHTELVLCVINQRSTYIFWHL